MNRLLTPALLLPLAAATAWADPPQRPLTYADWLTEHGRLPGGMTPDQWREWQAEQDAARLLDTRSHYVSRADALLMDDRPDVRAALKRLAVSRGLMLGYQANLFDDGFGQAVQALMHARDARERAERLPDVPIRFGPPDKGK